MTGAAASRLAFVGRPGVGKSTLSAMLVERLATRGRTARIIRTAEPLYDMQRAFLDRVGSDSDGTGQDGPLLNFFGSHFRQIRAEFLIDDFIARVTGAEALGTDVVLCGDARPVDVEPLRSNGFRIVRVDCDPMLRRARKADRGDLLAGDDQHETESGLEQVDVDDVLSNDGSLQDLGAIADRLVETIAGSPAHPVDLARVVSNWRQSAYGQIARRYRMNRHQIAAALITADGRVITGLHVEAAVGRASTCAEAVALSKAVEQGAAELAAVLAVRHPKPTETGPATVVPPCGLCREILLDYAPDIRVVVDDGGISLLPLAELLPFKYRGTKWQHEREAVR